MTHSTRWTFCLILAFFISYTIQARHIIGSDFTYSCTGISNNNTRSYELSLTMYRDCYNPEGSRFDPLANFGIYRYSNGRYTYVRQVSVAHGPVSEIKPDNDPCVIIPPIVCVEKSSYIFKIDLPVINETYVIYYMRCCRNNTIVNLLSPNTTGATFFIEITPEAQQECDQSPAFNKFPPLVICADFPFEFNHSASDADGDSLVYEFCTPLAGGGTDGRQGSFVDECERVIPNPALCSPPFQYVNFVPSVYGYDYPLGRGILNLNPSTGMLDGLPKELGQFVVGICVKSYRNGVYIGAIHRDFQFNVSTCEQAVTAKIKADSIQGDKFTINFCGDKTVNFNNLSGREEYINSYYWEFSAKNNPGSGTLTSTIRNAAIDFPGPGEYTGMMIVNRNARLCSDTALINLKIIPSDLKAEFDFVHDKCSSAPIQFMDRSTQKQTAIKTYFWEFDDGESNKTKSPKHLFRHPGTYDVKFTIGDGGVCTSSATKQLAYYPAPDLLDILPDKFRACVPATIKFLNLSFPIDSTYLVEWDFGDGKKTKGIHAEHTYASSGIYSIGLSIQGPGGCVTTENFNSFIRVQDGPVADFDYSPRDFTILDPTVKFQNLSKDAIHFSWNFGDNFASETKDPNHKYKDTGVYKITLLARHENGCIDTVVKSVIIGAYISYFLPNAFTPNNDGINDTYFGTGSTIGMKDFNMSIFNRWGELIYFSDDPFGSWNGRKKNAGPLEPNGVYVCRVRYKDDKGQIKELHSPVSLIR